jgi:hypothetical protein
MFPPKTLGGTSPYDLRAYPDCSYPPRCAKATVLEASLSGCSPKNRHPYLRSRDFSQCYVTLPYRPHQEPLRDSRPEQDVPPPNYAQCRMMVKTGKGEVGPQRIRNDESATARVFRARSLVPRSQWMINCEPRCTDEEADRIWTDATESSWEVRL